MGTAWGPPCLPTPRGPLGTQAAATEGEALTSTTTSRPHRCRPTATQLGRLEEHTRQDNVCCLASQPLPSLTKCCRPQGDISQNGLCCVNTSLLLYSHRAAPHVPPARGAAARALHTLSTRAAATGSSSAVRRLDDERTCASTLQEPLSPSCQPHHQLGEQVLFRGRGLVWRQPWAGTRHDAW